MMGQLPLTATRLRIALGRAGIKQVELSEKTGIPKSAISQYLSGKVKPKQDKVYLMAKALDVSELWLMGMIPDTSEDTPNVFSSADMSQYLAVCDTAGAFSYPYVEQPCAAGIPTTIEGISNLKKLVIPNMVMGKNAGNSHIIIMRVNGESMNKVIPDGAFIAVNTNIDIQDLKSKDIVVFKDQFEGYSVKRFQRINHRLVFRPESTNPDFFDITFNEDENVNIIGKVVTYIVNL